MLRRASHVPIDPPISADRWAELLQEAGYPPTSWADLNAPQAFASAITTRLRDTAPAQRRPRDIFRKEHAAVAELRRLLPKVVRKYQREIDEYARRSYEVDRGDLEATQRLLAVLPDDKWLAPLPGLEIPAYTDVRRLLRLINKHVRPAKATSTETRAVKFLAAALEAMGHEPPSPEAIAKYLYRYNWKK